MKKIAKILSLIMLIVLTLSGCGEKTKIDLSDTKGRVLEKSEAKGMLGVEGKIIDIDDDSLSVNVSGKTYLFERSQQFNKELINVEKKHSVKKGTYVQVYYEEKVTSASSKYNDLKNTKNIAKGISLVTTN